MNDNERSNLARTIRKYREARKMTMKQLSIKSGINLSTIKNMKLITEILNLNSLKNSCGSWCECFEFLDIEVKSISDIISLVNKMNNATEIEWDIDNEKVSISFKNENINNSLKDYALDYRCKDINIENESSDSEATLTRLMLINNSLK